MSHKVVTELKAGDKIVLQLATNPESPRTDKKTFFFISNVNKPDSVLQFDSDAIVEVLEGGGVGGEVLEPTPNT